MKYSSSLSSMFMAITEGLLPASKKPNRWASALFPHHRAASLCFVLFVHTLHPSLSATHHPRWMEKVTWWKKRQQASKGDGGSARALEQSAREFKLAALEKNFWHAEAIFSLHCVSHSYFFHTLLKLLPLSASTSLLFFRQIITATRDVTHKKMLIFSHSSPPASI